MIRLLTAAAAVLVFALALPVAAADEGNASIEGIVTDQAGKPIQGAVVRTRNAMTETTANSVTNERGEYLVERVHQGRYSMFATAEGYNPVWVREVIVYSGEHLRQDFRLSARIPSSNR